LYQYEDLIGQMLDLATQAQILGESEEPGSAAFRELGAIVRSALMRVASEYLPGNVMHAISEQAEAAALSRVGPWPPIE
jgi:hypothetical protein